MRLINIRHFNLEEKINKLQEMLLEKRDYLLVCSLSFVLGCLTGSGYRGLVYNLLAGDLYNITNAGHAAIAGFSSTSQIGLVQNTKNRYNRVLLVGTYLVGAAIGFLAELLSGNSNRTLCPEKAYSSILTAGFLGAACGYSIFLGEKGR